MKKAEKHLRKALVQLGNEQCKAKYSPAERETLLRFYKDILNMAGELHNVRTQRRAA